MKDRQKSITEWYRWRKCGSMDRNVECLCFNGVESAEYFQLLGMRYSDMNAVTQRAHF